MSSLTKTHFLASNLFLSLGVIVIILTSFFLFSTAFYPFISSDDALNVLMAHDYSLPENLYCWGQDRGGTLIPLLSQIFIKPFGIPAYMAVSISNYLVLILGFWGISTLFKDKRIVLLLALFWFFPYQRFLQIVVFPIGMGYSLLGFSILFIRSIDFQKNIYSHFPNILRLGIISFIWLLAVWCSDLVFVSLLTLLGTFFLYNLVNEESKGLKKWQYLIVFAGILSFIFLIIQKAKTYALVKTEEFFTLNSMKEIGLAVTESFKQSTKVLMGSEDLILTVGAWMILSILLIGLYFIIQYRKAIFKFKNLTINFFLFETIGMLAVIFLSNWVLLNEMGRWYFVAPYISFGLLFLLLIDQIFVFRSNRKFISAIVVFILLGSSNISNVMHHTNGQYKAMTSTISELNSLGEIGIIANYWDAYRMSIVNPDQIIATPKEGGGVRNDKLVRQVFDQPKIYISKDMWMDEFPDSLVQFGITLYKKGEERHLGGSFICEYEMRKKATTFDLAELKFNPSLLSKNKESLILRATQSEMVDQMLVYGPFISLHSGTYSLKIYTDSKSQNMAADALLFDISHDFGKQSSGFEALDKMPLISDSTGTFFLKKFLVEELRQHTEFRILVKKPIDMVFYKYLLIPE